MKRRFRFKRQAAAYALLLAAALPLLCACSRPPERPKRLCDYDVDVYSVLLGDPDPEADNALRLCLSIVTALRFGKESEWTEELYEPIDRLMEQYYENGYLPRDPYPGLDEKYVTSMDAPLLAVTAELAYERSGDERFRQYMEDLIPYLVKGTEEDGYVLKLSDSEWWPLEYAWNSVTEETAWFVSNGSFFGMVGIEMLRQLTGDPRLAELSEKALNAYKAKADAFYYPDGSWCYYSLNFLDGIATINRPEKLLIETRALKALYLLTGESFYQEELDRRTALLEKLLPVYIVEEEDGTNTAMLLRACAPHPYIVEIYPSTLELLDAGGEAAAVLEAPTRLVENSCILGKVPAGVESYRLYGKLDSIHNTLLVEQPVTHIQRSDLTTAPVSGTWSCSGDAVSVENGLVSIDAEASEKPKAFTWFKPDEPVEYGAEVYWVVELDNPTEETFVVASHLYDQNDVVMNRYLLDCAPGKSLQVVSHIGYKDHDWPLDKAAMLSLEFVTNSMRSPQAEIQIGNVYVFTKTAEVVNYLSQYEFTDFWTIAG